MLMVESGSGKSGGAGGKTKGGEGVPPHVAAPSPPYTYLAQSPSDCEHSSGIHGAEETPP
jgi:hypothetical protein